jgi:hypothetical protein
VGKPEENKPFGIPRHRGDDSIKVFEVIRLVGMGRKLAAGPCGHGGRISGFIKFGAFPDRFIKKDSASEIIYNTVLGHGLFLSIFFQNLSLSMSAQSELKKHLRLKEEAIFFRCVHFCGSVHHSIIHKENPTRCNSVSKFYFIFM